MKMNNRGQILGIISFVVIVIILIFLAPFLMRIVITPVDKVTTALQGIDTTNKSSDATSFIRAKFVGMFDWVIAFFVLFSIIILLITSFLIDVHPAFVIVYVVAGMFLFIFAPAAMTALDTIYNSAQFSVGENNVIQYLPITAWLKDNYIIFLLGVFVLSGLIMFGKYRLTGGGIGRGGSY